jgi:phosphotransferase system IIA component
MSVRAPLTGLIAVLFLTAPAYAISAKDKMETCKFGADDQKLTGKEHKAFITKCMAKSDSPATHKGAKGKSKSQKKTAAPAAQ